MSAEQTSRPSGSQGSRWSVPGKTGTATHCHSKLDIALDKLFLCECSYFLRLSPSNRELFYWTLCYAFIDQWPPLCLGLVTVGVVRLVSFGAWGHKSL